MYAGRSNVADALRADLRPFRDQQTGGGPLRVVDRGKRVGDVTGERATARHRRHHEAIRKTELTKSIVRVDVHKLTILFISNVRQPVDCDSEFTMVSYVWI